MSASQTYIQRGKRNAHNKPERNVIVFVGKRHHTLRVVLGHRKQKLEDVFDLRTAQWHTRSAKMATHAQSQFAFEFFENQMRQLLRRRRIHCKQTEGVKPRSLLRVSLEPPMSWRVTTLCKPKKAVGPYGMCETMRPSAANATRHTRATKRSARVVVQRGQQQNQPGSPRCSCTMIKSVHSLTAGAKRVMHARGQVPRRAHLDTRRPLA